MTESPFTAAKARYISETHDYEAAETEALPVVIKDVHEKIEKCVLRSKSSASISVPHCMYGAPDYNHANMIEAVSRELKNSGFTVTKNSNPYMLSQIIVSWEKPQPDVKPQTSPIEHNQQQQQKQSSSCCIIS